MNDDNESFQRSSLKLSSRLKEVLTSKRKDILITIPGAFHNLRPFNNYATNFWELFLAEYGKDIIPYLSIDKTYYDTNMSRLYIDWKDKSKSKSYFNYLRKLWNNKRILIIEGHESRLGVGNKLFQNARVIYRIECPNINAFESYTEILNSSLSFLHNHKNILTLIALGPTATILAYDLSNRGYRSIDIGNIDLEYEWMLMGATHKVDIPSRFTIEAKGGTHVTNVNDSKYNSEIVKDI